MSLSGRLEDVGFFKLLLAISATARTGILRLSAPDGSGTVAFRHGKVIFAASGAVRESLGNMLVCRGLINENTLKVALRRQRKAPEERRLGTILVEMRAIDQPTLEDLVLAQTRRVMAGFFTWRSGEFSFETKEIRECGEVEVAASDLILEGGLGAEDVVLDVLRTLASMESEQAGLTTLRSIMDTVVVATVTAEATLQVFRTASRVVSRGALFLVTRDTMTGIGQFGVAIPGVVAEDRVRSLVIPADHASVLADVHSSKCTYCGPLAATFWNEYLVRELGGCLPREVLAVPAIGDGKVMAILYGDNAYTGRPIGRVTQLELLMLQVGSTLVNRPGHGLDPIFAVP